MSRILTAPGKFVIGNGELGRLAGYVSAYGTPLLLVAHRDDALRVKGALDQVEADGAAIIHTDFSGEATWGEVERIGEICAEKDCKAVVGLGGGKAIDVAKLVAHEQKRPAVIVPTIASSDAPCSKMAVLYTEDHVYADTVLFPDNPDLVLVDSGIIAKAPERFLVAGMGDAFATYYEGRACVRSGAKNYNDALTTNAAFALAKLCNEILLADSEKALAACRKGIVTEALENVIEANILLSGIGFESVGLSVAHAICAGFTLFSESNDFMHGEKVAVGLLVQLVLENASMGELGKVMDYYRAVGLPTSLKAIGISNPSKETLRNMADLLLADSGSCIHNMPMKLDAEMVYNAVVYVEQLDELFPQ